MASNVTNKPESFTIQIQGRLLNNLGINMYGSLGKCLVELAANAYDGDAPAVDIELNMDAIASARQRIRAEVKADALSKGLPVPTIFQDTLADLTVVISDKGHGMTPQEVQEKFLPINRDRRADPNANGQHTEAGKRFVMGRKGIGKLSGFGAATSMAVTTKRAGETFSTTFILLEEHLVNAQNLSEIPIPASYTENLPAEQQGTTIVLSGLKCDSMKVTAEQLAATLAEAFYPVRTEEFAIRINGSGISKDEADTRFTWPPDRDPDGMASGEAGTDDTGKLPFKYVVKFRKRSLGAAKRGARIYCNSRLAFGPSLLDLKTGTHNFMAHQYMECIVEADELDRQNVDLISIDRGDLRRDNDLVESFVLSVTKIMQDAIRDEEKYSDEQADTLIEVAPELLYIKRQLGTLSATQRKAGRELMRVMVSRYGHNTQEFHTIAPLIMSSMGAGEVLVKLIEVASDPRDIERVLGHLLDLQRIQEDDALKIYRGRRDGIKALRSLMQEGEDTWVKGARKENQLQELLKKCAWLIDPALSDFVCSDDDMDKVISGLAKHLEIDDFAALPSEDDEERKRDLKRPDLVFLLGDVRGKPNNVLVVELKAPNIPLDVAHLQQLKSYLRKVEHWLKAKYPEKHYLPKVRGILIGAMPDDKSRAEGALDLLEEISKAGPLTQWEVVPLRLLIDRTESIHKEMIGALETKEKEEMILPMPGKALGLTTDVEIPSLPKSDVANEDPNTNLIGPVG